MIDRICISINNRCNLRCKYCHFRAKGNIEKKDMDIFKILDNVKNYARSKFKIGFVGNGEPFLDWDLLKNYIEYLKYFPNISMYTITNGTVDLADSEWLYLKNSKVKVGISIDGYKEIHNANRGETFDLILNTINHIKNVTGDFPTFNATVGKDSIKNFDKIIEFFKPFRTRVTFSRMIGKDGISLADYHKFLNAAAKEIEVRRGGKDCTMYGGQCGAGINNFFYANGQVYLCGNCIDLPPICSSDTPLDEIEKNALSFDRNYCYKESLCV